MHVRVLEAASCNTYENFASPLLRKESLNRPFFSLRLSLPVDNIPTSRLSPASVLLTPCLCQSFSYIFKYKTIFYIPCYFQPWTRSVRTWTRSASAALLTRAAASAWSASACSTSASTTSGRPRSSPGTPRGSRREQKREDCT